LTFPEGRDETDALNFKPHFGIMRRTVRHLLRTRRLCYGVSLLLATCAFGETGNQFAFGDITKPDFFPILPWDFYHSYSTPVVEHRPNGLESIADCGFNMAGFVQPGDLRRCEKLHLGAILIPAADNATSPRYGRGWNKLSDQEIERRIKQLIRAAGKSPAIKGYYVMDEPGVADFPALGKAVAAVKKHAPGKLAYINLFPDYATLGALDRSQLGTSNYTEYLERFVAEVNPQVISYDNYMVPFSDDLKDAAKAASYYHNLLEVRRVAQKHQLPCLNIVSANQIRPPMPAPSPASLQFQAYTTLAAGYRGVTWYNYYGPDYKYAAIDPAGRKTLTWIYLRDVNSQIAALAPVMSRLASTGVFFSAPAPVDDLPLLPGNLVEAVTCPTPVMIGEFKHANGSAYVMIVNLSLERSAKFTLTTRQPDASIEVVSAVDGSRSAFDPKAGLWLTAGQGVLLALGK
jgi:hypothetical protein